MAREMRLWKTDSAAPQPASPPRPSEKGLLLTIIPDELPGFHIHTLPSCAPLTPWDPMLYPCPGGTFIYPEQVDSSSPLLVQDYQNPGTHGHPEVRLDNIDLKISLFPKMSSKAEIV